MTSQVDWFNVSEVIMNSDKFTAVKTQVDLLDSDNPSKPILQELLIEMQGMQMEIDALKVKIEELETEIKQNESRINVHSLWF